MESGASTVREIHSQPKVWSQCLDKLDKFDLESLVGDKDPRTHEWIFVGRGASYYLAQAAAATFTILGGAPARAVPASEMLLSPKLVFPIKDAAVFPILISRSEHTSEVLQVAELLRQRGIEFLAVTCDGNELTQLSTRTLKLPVTEASTVMTSSFTSMLIALQYIAARFVNQNDFLAALHAMPAALAGLLPIYGPRIEEFAHRSFDDVAFLGQGALYPIASESALKVMESWASYAQFFHTLEFRHGPMSIVSEKVMMGALLSDAGYAEESAVLLEMKGLGGCSVAIANQLSPEVASSADLAIELGLAGPELSRLAVYVVWGQLLGSRLGLRKGLDPDSPRHLSRVVTLVD